MAKMALGGFGESTDGAILVTPFARPAHPGNWSSLQPSSPEDLVPALLVRVRTGIVQAARHESDGLMVVDPDQVARLPEKQLGDVGTNGGIPGIAPAASMKTIGEWR